MSEINMAQESDDSNVGNWVTEHRQIIEHRIWKCAHLYQMWRFLIMEAKWQDDVYSDGKVKIPLKRGQCVCSISHLEHHLNMSRSKTHFKLNSLRKLNAIETKVEQGITVITICNYDKYQCSKNNHKTEVERTSNKSGTQFDTDVDPSKELKTKKSKNQEIKKEEKELTVNPQPLVGGTRKRKLPPLSDHDMNLASRWLAFAVEKLPTIKATQDSFAIGIHKMKKALGFTDQQADALFQFVTEDDFWKTNAYSPCGLLAKSKNGLRKVDNILAKLRKEKYSHLDVMKYAQEHDAAIARGEKPPKKEYAF